MELSSSYFATMSTRSGKRIHNSVHENSLKPDVEQEADSERKTRSKRLKENVEEFSASLIKNKKRVNYVSYPSDEEPSGIETVDSKEDEGRFTRTLRKNALREQNLVTSAVSVEPQAEVKKAVRFTRRTHKFAEDTQENQNHLEEVTMAQKPKKGRKKKQPGCEQVTEEIIISKKKGKKKKVKRSNSIIVEDIQPENGSKNSLNKSNTSIDSFHSAAGGPLSDLDENPQFDMIKPLKDSEVVDTTFERNDDENHTEKLERRRTRSTTRLNSTNLSLDTPNTTVRESRKRKSSVKDMIKIMASNELIEQETELEEPLQNTFNKVSKKRKSNIMDTVSNDIKNSTYDLEDLEKNESKSNATVDLENLRNRKSTQSSISEIIEGSNDINTTYDKDELRKSFLTDSAIDKSYHSVDKNTTHNKETVIDISIETKRQTRQSVLNTTFEKSVSNSQIDTINDSIKQMPALINTTFEKDSDIVTNQKINARKSSIKNSTFDKDDLPSEIHSETPNLSLRKSILSMSPNKLSTEMNSTYDKIEKLDSTFDKDKNLDVLIDKSSKSSLVSSDNSNVTLDKSDVSRISITSDDSKENIVNMTPVLIESSLDESQMNITKLSPKCSALAPSTPLKREGTFTKDDPEVTAPSTPKLLKTPTKRMSLPSPGCTPFHTKKVDSKEKSVLNVTRSLEKSRRSSLAEPLPKTTKVMFCSPVNNPAVVLQQRRKVIKSNLKGSNKSFVFDDRVAMDSRPPPRKRSYTQSDADDAQAKRKRLTDGLQHSVDRLSRPRTFSASADPGTPSKKPGTPSKKSEAKISRTKLPNFAALHRKEFDKMESLGECQERKAKRAKQLLTPTGAITVLERSSPRENSTEPKKSPTEPKEELTEQNNKNSNEPKKPETPVKSLPTLKSLNPGFTRFGFKLNLDVNPFSIPSKSDAKNKAFNFSTRKDNKAKTSSVFSFSSKKDNTKPLKEIKTNLRRQATLPSLTGTTSLRKEVAKQTVMREKSFTDKRNINRDENRTVIKGVRTNRRFELQMRMRNLD